MSKHISEEEIEVKKKYKDLFSLLHKLEMEIFQPLKNDGCVHVLYFHKIFSATFLTLHFLWSALVGNCVELLERKLLE